MRQKLTQAEQLSEYRAARYCAAREERNRGKTAFELVQECEPLDIDRVYRVRADHA